MPSSSPAQHGYLRKRNCRFPIAKAYPAVHTDPLGQGFAMARAHPEDGGSLGSLTIRSQPFSSAARFSPFDSSGSIGGFSTSTHVRPGDIEFLSHLESIF